MDELTGILAGRAGLNPGDVFIFLGFVVAALTGGAFPRTHRVLAAVLVVIAARIAGAATGSLMVEMLVGGVTSAAVLGYGLTRRGMLRLALVGFALGSFGNVAVVLANGAMPFDDRGGTLTTSATDLDRYEPITDSTDLRWLADTIRVPGFGGLASAGDLLLWTSIAAGIVAVAHSPDGKGGTGRRRSAQWYHDRFDAAIDAWELTTAQSVLAAGLQGWPDDLRLRWDSLTLALVTGEYGAAADGALEVLARRSLPDETRGRFLDAYADGLLMAGDPATLDTAERALGEAERLLPRDIRLMTNRALLALRRGDLQDAAAGARLVLARDFPGENPRARMVLLDTLLAQYWKDGRAVGELLDLLENLGADPDIQPEARYVCALAAYHSHAGDHAAATRVLRVAAGSRTDPDEMTAISYHLAYVLARSDDAAAVPEIDRLLHGLPAGYPSVPARSHTNALRHLAAGEPQTALADAEWTIEHCPLAPVEAAEVHLTAAKALAALGRHPEAARSCAAALQHAPGHQLLELATA